MDDQLKKILKKAFSCSDWDDQRAVNIYKIDVLKPPERDYILQSGFELNQPVLLTHDAVIQGLKTVLQKPELTWARCVKGFIASMHSAPRGTSPLLSYLYARRVERHAIQSRADPDQLCLYCGGVPEEWHERSFILYCLHSGRLWDLPAGYFFDLEEFSSLPVIEPTKIDWGIFDHLMAVIQAAVPEESVSRLEKRIRAEKVFMKYHPGRVRDILFVLSQLGVLPSASLPALYDGFSTVQQIYDSQRIGSSRSDIAPPLNGWRGRLKINEQRIHEIFDVVRNTPQELFPQDK